MLSRRLFLKFATASALTTSFSPTYLLGESCKTMGIALTPPTQQRPLDGSLREGIFMDTGTGRPESGMFGNVRKYANGTPRFHEGIDIAPMAPWRRNQRPKDLVCAVANGRIVYINHKASLYGNYIVCTHPVENFGDVYTLYAHLSKIAPSLKVGSRAIAGMVLGQMGNTPDIPIARSHLHFEIGVMMNSAYPLIDNDHGIWNGANLYGIDPCDAFKTDRFDIRKYLLNKTRAFSIVVVGMKHCPEYFKRYPCFWRGKPFDATIPTVIDFSYEGIPISGENYYALPDQTIDKTFVLSWQKEELLKGRPYLKNGRLTERGYTLLDNLYVSPEYCKGKAMGEVG